ncbi:MAG: YadA-like family protein [Pseudomonadota bacterium]
MNKVFRIIWNRTLGRLVVASEAAHTQGKSGLERLQVAPRVHHQPSALTRLRPLALAIGLAATGASIPAAIAQDATYDTLTVSGTAILSALQVSGNASFDGTLTVGSVDIASAIDTNTTNVGSLDTRVGENESAITGLGTDISVLDSRVGDNESSISTNTTNIGDLNSRIGDNESAITVLDTDIGDLDARVGNNETSIAALENTANAGWDVTDGSSQANIGPGGTVTFTGDSNISVTQSGTDDAGAVDITLDQDVEVTSVTADSVITGNATIDNDGLTVGTTGPSVTSTGIDAGGQTITNVAAGDLTATSTDAVIGSQIYDLFIEEGAGGVRYFRALSAQPDAEALGNESIAIGPNTVAEGDSSFAVGDGAVSTATAEGSIALGQGATVGTEDGAVDDGMGSTAIGRNSRASGNSSLALGDGARVEDERVISAMAIGTAAVVSGMDSNRALAAGFEASASAADATAVGASTNASGGSATAVGAGAKASGGSSIALGDGASSSSGSGLAAGTGASVASINSIALGTEAGVGTVGDAGGDRTDHIAIGTSAGQNVEGNQTTAVGFQAGSGVTGDDNIAIGTRAGQNLAGNFNVSLGYEANLDAGAVERAIAIGGQTEAARDAVAVGYNAEAADNGVALGANTLAGSTAVALGRNAEAEGGSVALGAGSAALSSDADGSGYLTGSSFADGTVVSVGNTESGQSRRVVNVADGAQDYDAVNVRQLKGAQESVAALVGGGVTLNTDGTYSPITVQDTNGDNVTFTTVVDAIGAVTSGDVEILPDDAVRYNADGGISNLSAGINATDAVNVEQLNEAVAENGIKYFSVNSTEPANRDNTLASGTDALAIGPATSADGRSSLAAGHLAKTVGAQSVALGHEVEALGVDSTAIGSSSDAYGDRGVAIGQQAVSQGENSLVIGTRAQADPKADSTVDNAIVIGTEAEATADNGIAVGEDALASEERAVAQGFNAEARADDAQAFGSRSRATGVSSQASGTDARASGASAQASGTDALASGTNSIATGTDARGYASDGIALGTGAQSGFLNPLPEEAYRNTNGIAIGNNALADNRNALSLGVEAQAREESSTALGDSAEATAINSLAVGSGARATEESASAFGDGAEATHERSVALGDGSVTSAPIGTSGATVDKVDYDYAGIDPVATVSVGNIGEERTITNVAAGRVGGTSTDAINGSQLFQTNQAVDALGDNLDTAGGSVASALGENAAYNPVTHEVTISNVGGTGEDTVHEAIEYAAQGWYLSANGEGASGFNVDPGQVANFADGQNIELSRSGDTITVSTADNVSFSSVDVAGDLTVDGETRLGDNFVVGNDSSVTYNGQEIANQSDGLSFAGNTGGNIDKTLGEGTPLTLSGQLAAGEASTGANLRVDSDGSQLNLVMARDLTELDSVTTGNSVLNTDGLTVDGGAGNVTNVGAGDITLTGGANNDVVLSTNGLDNGDNKIVNVADGEISETSTDAINGSQLHETNQELAKGINVGDGSTSNNFALGDTINVTGDANVTSTTTAEGVELGLSDVLNVGTMSTVTIDGDNGTVSGLTNTDLDGTNFAQAGRAATEEQLEVVNQTANAGWNVADTSGNRNNIGPNGTVTFAGDSNVTVTESGVDDDANVQVALNDDITVDSVTTGNSVLNTDGLTVDGGTGNVTEVTAAGTSVTDGTDSTEYGAGGMTIVGGPSVTSGGIDAADNKIVNVADGEISATSADAINGSQLQTAGDSLANNVLGGDADYTGNDFTMSDVGGTGEDTIDDAIRSANTAANAGWNLSAEGDAVTTANIGPNGGVDFQGDDNIGVAQSGADDAGVIDITLDRNLDVDSVTAGDASLDTDGLVVTDASGNQSTTTTTGTTVTDAAGNETVVDASGVTVGDDVALNDSGLVITGGPSVTDTGIDAGNQVISNVADGVADNDAVNVSQLTNLAETPLTFAGDSGTDVERELGETLNLVGGETDTTALVDGNIGVVADGSDTLSIQLAQNVDLGSDGSVTTGDTVMNNAGVSVDDAAGNTTEVSAGSINVAGGGNSIAIDGGAGDITGLTNTDINGADFAQAGRAATEEQLDLVNQIANAGWNLTGSGADEVNIGPDGAVDFQGDGNIGVAQSGVDDDGQIDITLNRNLDVDSVTAGDASLDTDGLVVTNASGNQSTTTATGTTVTDAAGNETVVDASGVTVGDDVALNDSGLVITGGPSVTDTGIDAGNQVISNVADGVADNDAVNVSQLTNLAETPLTFAGDSGTDVERELGETLNLVGGETDSTALVDGNIGVVADGSDTLSIQLAQNVDLGSDGSVTTGNSVLDSGGLTVDDGAGNVTAVTATGTSVTDGTNSTEYGAGGMTIADGPSVTTGGIDAGDRKITSVADGDVNSTSSDAINGSQLQASGDSLANNVLGGNADYTGNDFTMGDVGGTGENTIDDAIRSANTTANAGWNLTGSGADEVNIGPDGTADFQGDDNIGVAQSGADDDGQIDITLNRDLDLDSVTAGDASLDTDGLAVADSNGNRTTTGATGTTVSDAAGNVTVVDAGGVRVGDDVALGDGGLTITDGPSVTTGGIDAGDQVITNVAAGTDDSDAVNVGQLTDLAETPLSFAGDSGSSVERELGETLNLVGGETDATALVDGNIGVVSDGSDTLSIQLAQNVDLGSEGSVTTGDTVMNDDGVSVDDAAGNTTELGAGSLNVAGAGNRIAIDGGAGDITGLTNRDLDGADFAQAGRAATEEQLDLVNQTANAGWNLTGSGADEVNIGPDGAVDFQGDGNIGVAQSGVDDDGQIDITLNRNLDVDSVTAGDASLDTDGLVVTDASGNQSTTTATGTTVTDAAGNETVVDASGVTVGDDVALNDSGLVITGGPSVTDTGIDAGNQVISNVADGVADNDAVNVSQLTNLAETPLTFAGDSGTDVERELGETLNLVGGETDSTALVDGNIGVVADGSDTLSIQLAQNVDLGSEGSVTTGDTVMNDDGVSVDDAAGNTTEVGAGSLNVAGAGNHIAIDGGAGDITGLTNTDINGADFAQAGRAATEEQLDLVNQTANAGWNLTGSGADEVNIGPDGAVDFQGDGNIGVAQSGVDDDGQIDITLNRNLDVDSVTAGDASLDTDGLVVNDSTDNPTATTNVEAGTITLAANPTTGPANEIVIDANSGTIGGLTNTTFDPDNFTSGQAATEDQLGQVYTVANAGWNVSVDGEGAQADGSNNVGPDGVVDFTSEDGNIVIERDGTDLAFNLADSITLGDGDTAITMDGETGEIGVGDTIMDGNGVRVGDGVTLGDTGLEIVDGPSVTTDGIDAGDRKIAGVAEGDVSESSTDAINGSQLYEVQQVANAGWNLSGSGANEVNIGPEGSVDFQGDKNISVAQSGDDDAGVIEVALNDTVTLGEDDNAITVDGTEGSITTGDTIMDGDGVRIGDTVALDETGLVITNGPSVTVGGIDAGGMQITSVGSGLGGQQLDQISGDDLLNAVNVGDLQQVAGDIGDDVAAAKTEVTEGKNISVTESTGSDGQTIYEVATADEVEFDKVDVGSVTIEKDNVDEDGNTIIAGVGKGEVSADSTDAVNGSQLHDVKEEIGDINTSLDGGMDFAADEGEDVNRKLGDTVAITGDDNITTQTSEDGVQVTLNNELNVDSVTTGKTTVSDAGVTIEGGPSMTADGIDGGGKRITNVAPGVDATDAVNVGQMQELNQRFAQEINNVHGRINTVEKDANAGTASALAAATVPQAWMPGKSMVGVGSGTYEGESAISVGVSRLSDNGRFVIQGKVTGDSQSNFGAGIGAGWHW